MAPAFAAGLTQFTGTISSDGWVYIAGGKYLWSNPRGVEEGISLVERWGAILKDHRYIGFSLLGFFSPLVKPGDTFAVAALFQAWVLFTTACSVFLFWATERKGPAIAYPATALTLVSGWMGFVVWGNYFDQGLALIFIPLMGSILALWPVRDWRRWGMLGVSLAGVLYAYPAGAPFLLGGGFLLALPWLWRERTSWPIALRGWGIAFCVGLVLLLPAIPCLVIHLQENYQRATTTGDFVKYPAFTGLLDWQSQPAGIWGLGLHRSPHLSAMAGNLWAWILSLFLLIGLGAQLTKSNWGVALNVLGLLGGLVYFLAREHFPYAAFKLITFYYWCVVGTVVYGGHALAPCLPWVGAKRLVTALVSATFILSYLSSEIIIGKDANQGMGRSEYQQIHQVGPRVRDASLTFAVEDAHANLIGIYYLDGLKLNVASHRGYMGIPVMLNHPAATAFTLNAPQYLLTDGSPVCGERLAKAAKCVWGAGAYRLWELDRYKWGADLLSVDGGSAAVRLGQGYLAGTGTAFLNVLALEPGAFRFEASVFPVDGQPAFTRWKIVSAKSGYEKLMRFGPGRQTFDVPVRPGLNRIEVRPLNSASGEPVPIMVHFQDIRTQFHPANRETPGAAGLFAD
jgi:hypothetical protein